jgi:hypothetical protein
MPVIATAVPTAPLVGVNEVIVGARYVYDPEDVAVPMGVVTDNVPDDPLGATAVIDVAETTVNEDAAVPLNMTAVAPVKFVPVIVTVVATRPDVGENDVIVGAAPTVNDVELVAGGDDGDGFEQSCKRTRLSSGVAIRSACIHIPSFSRANGHCCEKECRRED